MEWIEISIKTTTEAVEAVSNILYDAGVAGVAIEDSNDFLFMEQSENSWDYVDESLLRKGFEGAIVKGYLPASADLVDKIDLIRQSVLLLPQFGLDIGLGEVTTVEVSEEDWSSSWKQYYKPTKIGNNVVIKPTWEEYTPEEGEMIIELDPGMAFGTGTHETTMMCVEALGEYVKPSSIIYDIGCGSGILSIAAAKMGANKVIAVDLDAVAVEVSKKNVLCNRVEDTVDVRHGNLMDTINGSADIIVANIIADIIILLAKDIKEFLVEDGIFISSGIITDKLDQVMDSLEATGLKVKKVKQMGEWAAIISQKQGDNNE
ncbi:50S ribosomal protein L11 methyltransferase [Alkaliphilus peptidifermentans]|uniref:Ribosomal protein L11 methyltransferase n=1 Tax=Alkaliphilus peptidifermentans DSM 18978 TaxID=1120976 RepID=A0A1G5BX11_9FIRM|nr:50S ribosomal protein L11 methyltransferase [Alkaliphilus peptidifermentans]SCX94626.1 [LSU ribosomal protein L11P]-lysine N-methyltransferase [Alkaliphilus peptidifermentans DSM 18978]